MNEPTEEKTNRAGVIIGTLFGLIVLYPLSIGPAIFLVRSVPAATPAVEAFYIPLLWVYQHFPACWQPLDNYINLWK
ncbi:MAG: hypothetical protein V4584_17125 [Verrucomicrobiota bacterium]